MTARPTLPQNLKLSDPTLTELFDDITDWTKTGDAGGVIATETSDFPPGCTSAITITPQTTSTGTWARKSIAPTVFGDNLGSVWVKSPDVIGAGVPVLFRFSKDANMANRFTASLSKAGVSDRLIAGKWRHFPLEKSLFASTGTISWSDPMNYIAIGCYDVNATYKIAKAEFGYRARPKCIIQFDGQYLSDYTISYPYMAARGIHATHYIYSIEGTGEESIPGPSRMSLAQIKELYAYGDAISVYPWGGAQDFTELDLETQTAHLRLTRDMLIANGMPRAAYHAAYSTGRWDANTLIAMANLNMRTGRTTEYLPHHMVAPVENNITISTREINQQAGKTLAAAITAINYGIQTGTTVPILMHVISETPDTYDVSVDDFHALIDYLYARRAAIDTVTIDEWYFQQSNPRYRSAPLTRA